MQYSQSFPLPPFTKRKPPGCTAKGVSAAQAPRCSLWCLVRSQRFPDLVEAGRSKAIYLNKSEELPIKSRPPLQCPGWSSLDLDSATPSLPSLPLAPGRRRQPFFFFFNRLGGAQSWEGRVFKVFFARFQDGAHDHAENTA